MAKGSLISHIIAIVFLICTYMMLGAKATSLHDSATWFNIDAYGALGLDFSKKAEITQSDIRKAYRQVSKRYHPDTASAYQTQQQQQKNNGENQQQLSEEEMTRLFHEVALAHEILKDEEIRAQYDEFIESLPYAFRPVFNQVRSGFKVKKLNTIFVALGSVGFFMGLITWAQMKSFQRDREIVLSSKAYQKEKESRVHTKKNGMTAEEFDQLFRESNPHLFRDIYDTVFISIVLYIWNYRAIQKQKKIEEEERQKEIEREEAEAAAQAEQEELKKQQKSKGNSKNKGKNQNENESGNGKKGNKNKSNVASKPKVDESELWKKRKDRVSNMTKEEYEDMYCNPLSEDENEKSLEKKKKSIKLENKENIPFDDFKKRLLKLVELGVESKKESSFDWEDFDETYEEMLERRIEAKLKKEEEELEAQEERIRAELEKKMIEYQSEEEDDDDGDNQGDDEDVGEKNAAPGDEEWDAELKKRDEEKRKKKEEAKKRLQEDAKKNKELNDLRKKEEKEAKAKAKTKGSR